MPDKNIPQSEPWFDENETKAVHEYMQSGGWLMEFEKTRELEEMIAKYVGSRHCVMLPNGTLSIWVALAVLGIGSGNEVIVPDYTMVATANAVRLAGATPVLVDINPDDMSLDAEKTEAAITKQTKAIILVSINGRCPRINDFVTLANKRGLHLVEDAAQSLGSTVGGNHLGTYGIIGSFSFSVPKVITTGQGGALVTNDDKIAATIRRFKDFGREKGGADKYDELGYNLKFTDLQAVIGIEQMRKLPWRVRRKKEIYKRFKQNLKNIKEVTFFKTNDETSPWFVDVLVADPNYLAEKLSEKGIESRRFYPPLHSLHFYNASVKYPTATDISSRGLWLPSSARLSDDEIDYVTEAIERAYDS